MFGRALVADMIHRSTTNETDRRRLLQGFGLAGVGAVGATLLGSAAPAAAAESTDGEATDLAVLNFALNLEYLEGEFYSYAVTGKGLPDSVTDGLGTKGGVIGGAKVPFKTKAIRQYAVEINGDESAHVKFLRAALGSAKVARPAIDLKGSFTTAARAAGVIGPNDEFNPFADEDSFLIGAFIFEDVGVTAYKGAAPLVTNKTYLEAAAGILAVEAYHAGIVRSALYQKGLQDPVNKISDLRDALDGAADLDQRIGRPNYANLVPTDENSIAFSRSAAQVLNVVYGTPNRASKGLFYPQGVNGAINTSGGPAA